MLTVSGLSVAYWCGNSFFCVLACVRSVRLVLVRLEGFVALRACFVAFLAFRGFRLVFPFPFACFVGFPPFLRLALAVSLVLAFSPFRVLLCFSFFLFPFLCSPSRCSARGGRGALRGLRASVPSLRGSRFRLLGFSLLPLAFSVLPCGFGLAPAGRSVVPCGSWFSVVGGGALPVVVGARWLFSVGSPAKLWRFAFLVPFLGRTRVLVLPGCLGSLSLLRPRGSAFPAVVVDRWLGRSRTRSAPGLSFRCSGAVRSGLRLRALGASCLPRVCRPAGAIVRLGLAVSLACARGLGALSLLRSLSRLRR